MKLFLLTIFLTSFFITRCLADLKARSSNAVVADTYLLRPEFKGKWKSLAKPCDQLLLLQKDSIKFNQSDPVKFEFLKLTADGYTWLKIAIKKDRFVRLKIEKSKPSDLIAHPDELKIGQSDNVDYVNEEC